MEPSYESQLKFRAFVDDEKDDSDLVAPSPSVVKLTDVNVEQSPMQEKVISSGPIFESTISELNPRETITPILKKTRNYVITPASESINALNQSNEPEIPADDCVDYELPKCKLVLRRPEYYTRPSIGTLDIQVTDEQECLVRDFTVGREGYGEVTFLGVTNVYGLNLDEIGKPFFLDIFFPYHL